MSTPAVQSLNLPLTPVEAAAACRELDGFVFLDSSDAGNELQRRWSLMTALPERIHRGNLRDPAPLSNLLMAQNRPCFDWGFPTGGLFGYVAYNGDYHFGEYHHLLAYDHLNDQWHVCGDPPFLDACLRKSDSTAPPSPVRFTKTTTKGDFIRAVERAQRWIAAGDIYQVNLSQQFYARQTCSPPAVFAVYKRLRDLSPAPYAAFLNLNPRIILSSSPECFLKISGRGITTRPIKGTKPRFADPAQDEKSAYDLLTSEKELAELVMITDLERNDLGQVCEYGSVRVSELLRLERFSHIFHLVSTVEGQLRGDTDHLEVLRRCFPGGSITGAPKKRAMEIIAALERVPRGLYTGAIGYFGWNGESQFSIAIRTLIRDGETWHFHVGAGIVADSDPEAEYEETLHKAAGILAACSSPLAGN